MAKERPRYKAIVEFEREMKKRLAASMEESLREIFSIISAKNETKSKSN